jgi:hypothetical protein
MLWDRHRDRCRLPRIWATRAMGSTPVECGGYHELNSAAADSRALPRQPTVPRRSSSRFTACGSASSRSETIMCCPYFSRWTSAKATCSRAERAPSRTAAIPRAAMASAERSRASDRHCSYHSRFPQHRRQVPFQLRGKTERVLLAQPAASSSPKRWCSLNRQEQRIGHLAFMQIREQRLPHHLGIAGQSRERRRPLERLRPRLRP